MANPLIVDGRNLLDPEETRHAASLRGHRRPTAPGDVLPQAPQARRNAGRLGSTELEAIILAGGKAERSVTLRVGAEGAGRGRGQAARRVSGGPPRKRGRDAW